MAIKIMQVINLIDWTGNLATTASPERAYVTPANYNGTLAWYFEIVSGSSTSGTVYLKNSAGSTTYATITIAAAQTRYRANIASPPSSTTEFAVFGAATENIAAARIIIIQSAGVSLTATETQIEIGNREETKSTGYSAYAPLTYPKYWLYTAANWDAIYSWQAEIVYKTSSTKGAVSARIESDDGSFGNWVSAGASLGGIATTPTRLRWNFTPVDGRNHRLAVYISSTKYTFDIYCAKIICVQTGTITKLETIQTIVNTYSTTGGLQNKDIAYYSDTTEWDGVTKTFYHEHDALASGASTNKLQSDPNGTPADIPNSSIAGNYRIRSSALTMPSGTPVEIDTYQTVGNMYHSKLVAVLVVAAGQSYSESITLAGAGDLTDTRLLALTGSMALGVSGGVGLSPAGSTYNPSITMGGGAALGQLSQADMLSSFTFPAAPGIQTVAGLLYEKSVILDSLAAQTLAAFLGIAGSLSLGTTANIAEGSVAAQLASLNLPGAAAVAESGVLSLVSALSLASGAGLVEDPIGALLASASLPSKAASSEQILIAVLKSLGLPAISDMSETVLLEILKSIVLSGSGAIESLAAMIAQGALIFAGNTGLETDGIVESGAPGDYYESLDLPALTALVQAALVDLFGSSTLPGVASISLAGLMQAVSSAVLSCGSTLTPAHILDRLGAAEFSGAAGISLGTVLQAINSVLLSASGSLSPAAVKAALNLLALAVAADLATAAGFEATNEFSLEAAAALAAVMTCEMGAQLGYSGLASLTLAAELGLIKTCSLAGIASLETSRQLSCAGFLALQSISALAPYLGPGIKRGYRLELILDELELDLKLN